MKWLGGLIITVGILMLIIPGFILPVKKNILKVGPIEVNKTGDEWFGWPVYTGAILIVGGIGVIIMDRKKNNNL